jgi:exopolysaccharide biosynthesis polyprenyl glycosylphosphotransferase
MAAVLRITPGTWAQQLADLVGITTSWVVAFALLPEFIGSLPLGSTRSLSSSLVLVAVAVLVTYLLLRRGGVYAGRPTMPRTDEISKLSDAVASAAAAAAVFAAFLDWHIGAKELIIGALLSFGIRSVGRGLLRDLRSTASTSDGTVVVGTGGEAADLCQLILDHPEARIDLLGVIGNHDVAERFGLAEFWLGPAASVTEIMHSHGAKMAIVTTSGFRAQQFKQIVDQLFSHGYDVHLSTGVTRVNQGRIATRSLSHEPLIVVAQQSSRRWQRAAKRLFDIAASAILLILFAPLLALVALAIKLESRGPVFFLSPRHGRGAEFFHMWKFRSMDADAHQRRGELAEMNERTGPLFKIPNDPRITRVGKFIRETSIDELPQLINVLKGEMSLVGPRPATPEEEDAFAGDYRSRFTVRPGITGLWQVEARSNAQFSAYERLDMHYLDNWSLTLDFRIILATAEQIAVTMLMLPLRPLVRASAVDSVDLRDDDVVIDLRQRFGQAMANREKRAKEAGEQITQSEPYSAD